MTAPEADVDRLLVQYGRLQESYDAAGGYTLEDRLSNTLKGLGIADKLEVSLSTLSGGQRIRVELARVLTDQADVLLLDEPTNHLDVEGINWLENYLSHSKQAYLVISHDREFLDNVVDQMIEIASSHSLNENESLYCKRILLCSKKKSCGCNE